MLKSLNAPQLAPPLVDVEKTARFIARVQRPDGEIPWSVGGKTDPWDHVESAMGLSVAGFTAQAKKAYLWSQKNQATDGSWWSEYRQGTPANKAYKDANMTAYIAVGALHYYQATADGEFLERMWPTVLRAIDFVLGFQGPEGQIYWAKSAGGHVEKRALLTGSSSIYMSLKCALFMADILGEKRPHWQAAKVRLARAICEKPFLFDQTKVRFSMDWYYPVLCGAVGGKAARKRIERRWPRFTIPGWGVKCVSDEPWLTMAETAELVLTFAAMGANGAAHQVYEWLHDKKYDDGSFWTGVTFPDRVIYTDEKTAWTAAAVLLATDSLYGLTPASRLFCHADWEKEGA